MNKRACAWLLGCLVWMPAVLVPVLVPAMHAVAAQDAAQTTPDRAARQWLSRLDAVPGQWQTVQGLTWFGRALWLRQVVLEQSLDEAAQQLTQIAPALDRLLIGPDSLLLSGVEGHLHLVVQLQRSPRGLEGFASVLELSGSPPSVHSVLDSGLAWVPHSTQVHASQWQLPDGAQVQQSIYVAPQTLGQVRAQLHRTLTQQGWIERAATTDGHDVQWQRGEDRWHVWPDRHGQGSLIVQVRVIRRAP